MSIEYEAKVLDIDPDKTRRLIQGCGGEAGGQRFMRRYVYDIDAGDPARWLRLRDTGSDVTLTVKEITDDTIDGTHETEIRVSDFDSTNTLLGRLGFAAKSYQETRRTSFTLSGARLEIDEWPHIPPYLEIEADTHDDVLRVAGLLGFAGQDLTSENTIKIYRRYGYDLDTVPQLRFDTEPPAHER